MAVGRTLGRLAFLALMTPTLLSAAPARPLDSREVIWLDRPSSLPEGPYPRRSLIPPPEGRVLLKCRVSAIGRLIACVIVSEDPAGTGLGPMSLRVARSFRVGPRTKSGKSTAGRILVFPMRFKNG